MSDDLKDSDRLWQATFDALSDAIWVFDAEQRVVRSNRQAEQLWQQTGGAAIGRHCWEIVHGTTGPIPDCPVQRAKQSGHRESLDLELGGRWYRVVGDPIFDEAANYAGAVHTVSDITDRKQAEQQVRDNEEKFRSLFETAQGAILLFANGRWTDCNEKATSVFGCSREEILGSHPSRFSPPTQPDGRDSGAESVQLITKAFNQEPQFFEWEHCRADGTPFAAEVNLNRIDLGGVPHIQAIVRDVTEQKRARAALELNAQRAQTLLQLNQMTAATKQEITDFVLEEAVRLTQSTLGYLAFVTEDETVLTMHSWSKAAMAECAIIDKPIVYPVASTGLWGEAIRQRRPVITNDYAAQNPLKKGCPQGHVQLHRHMNVPVFDGTRIVIVAGVGNKSGEYGEEDTVQLTLLMEGMWRLLESQRTEQEIRRTHEALRQSEERYREAQTMGHIGHWSYDPASRQFMGSAEALRIYGFPEVGTVAFEDVLNCISATEVERVLQGLFSVIQGGGIFDEEFEIHPRGSSDTRVLWSMAELKRETPDGPLLVCGILQDITERRRAEDAVRTLNAELEQRVRDRTLELEASTKELEAFSYSVSHDLRAPLRSIDGFSLALLEDFEDKLDADGRDYLRRIRAATQRMGLLIDDMLRLSRITRAEMVVEKVNLTELAWSVIHELQKSQPGRVVDVRIADGLEDLADPKLMRIALENLLGNAWKFTGKRADAVIEFGATIEGDKKTYFVRDNGAGFDMAYVNKLFTPFQRLHSMEEYPGTGIGLGTVARILHRHGGTVRAEGQVDRGATFHFSFQR